MLFHERIYDLQRRFLRIIAVGLGAHEDLFESMLPNGSTLTRAIRYPPMPEAPTGSEHVWAGEHADINLITALPRATAPGLQVKTDDGWVDAVAPEGRVIINTGMMLEVLSNGVIPPGVHRVVVRPRVHGRALQRRAVLPPDAVDDPLAAALVLRPRHPAALRRHRGRRQARRGPLRDQPGRRRPKGVVEGGRDDHPSSW